MDIKMVQNGKAGQMGSWTLTFYLTFVINIRWLQWPRHFKAPSTSSFYYFPLTWKWLRWKSPYGLIHQHVNILSQNESKQSRSVETTKSQILQSQLVSTYQNSVVITSKDGLYSCFSPMISSLFQPTYHYS